MSKRINSLAISFAFFLLPAFCSLAEGEELSEEGFVRVASQVERIAAAAKAYEEKKGEPPPFVAVLKPDYCSAEDLKLIGSSPDIWASIIFLAELSSPDDPSMKMIGFSSIPYNGKRFVMTRDWQIWVVGELRFQYWVSGLGDG